MKLSGNEIRMKLKKRKAKGSNMKDRVVTSDFDSK